jgi:hypothetical protein
MKTESKLTFDRYRTIKVRMWGDEKFTRLSPIPPSGQSLWVYMLTGPHTGPIPGLFSAGRAGMAETLGWSQEAFDQAFREVFDQGLAEADWHARVVWIPKALEHNKPQSTNVIISWAQEWRLIPECDLKRAAHESLRASVYMVSEAFGKAFDKAIPSPKPSTKPSPKPSTKAKSNQEQEQEQVNLKTKSQSQTLMSISPQASRLDVTINASDVSKIFAYWQQRMKSPRSRLDANRERLIRAALKHFSPADLCKAIRGCSKDPWHMGMNDKGRRFNSIELILRDTKHIEQFMGFDEEQAMPVRNEGPLTLQERRRRTLEEFGLVARAGDDPMTLDLPPEDVHVVTAKS